MRRRVWINSCFLGVVIACYQSSRSAKAPERKEEEKEKKSRMVAMLSHLAYDTGPAYVWLLENEMDEMRLANQWKVRECYVHIEPFPPQHSASSCSTQWVKMWLDRAQDSSRQGKVKTQSKLINNIKLSIWWCQPYCHQHLCCLRAHSLCISRTNKCLCQD